MVSWLRLHPWFVWCTRNHRLFSYSITPITVKPVFPESQQDRNHCPRNFRLRLHTPWLGFDACVQSIDPSRSRQEPITHVSIRVQTCPGHWLPEAPWVSTSQRSASESVNSEQYKVPLDTNCSCYHLGMLTLGWNWKNRHGSWVVFCLKIMGWRRYTPPPRHI